MIRLQRPPCPNPRALQTDYRHATNKDALRQACADKCMYCESTVSHVYYGDVEHIRPKAEFPDLEFEWDNLGYVCAKCNGAKGGKWIEVLPYVNPFEENPDEHLVAIGAFILERNGSERGEVTQRDIALNRPDLLERRGERIRELTALVDKATRTGNPELRASLLAELDQYVADRMPYAMAGRAALSRLR